MKVRTNEALQGFVGFVVVTLGVVPLIMLALGAQVGGLWSLVLAEDPGPARWIWPCVVVLAGVVAFALLERRKQ